MLRLLVRLLLVMFLIAMVPVVLVLLSDITVEQFAKDKVFDDVQQLPVNKVGVLLGTNKHMSNGNINRYYRYRIDAAVELYRSGKVSFILASGDNSIVGYDEPEMMRQDLIARGVPDERIFLDYAGFRTLDSVVRAQKIFGQEKVTFISQQFHNERAVFIANNKGMSAVGYNARGVNLRSGIKVVVRERFARVKMMLDLLLGKQPKFLGEPVQIA